MLVVGGVGELYQGDLDVGRRVVEGLQAAGPLGAHVVVEDLHYGALAVVQRLQDLTPEALVLVGARAAGRAPASVARTLVAGPPPAPEEAQRLVEQAATGYVGVDLVVGVATALHALPDRTVVFEVEPVDTGPGDQLSAPVATLLPELVELVRTEVERTPLFALVQRIRHELAGRGLEPSPSVEDLGRLLDAVDGVDETGRWGDAFRSRDRLRRHLATTEASAGMEHVDWGLWWALIEELDRLERIEAARA